MRAFRPVLLAAAAIALIWILYSRRPSPVVPQVGDLQATTPPKAVRAPEAPLTVQDLASERPPAHTSIHVSRADRDPPISLSEEERSLVKEILDELRQELKSSKDPGPRSSSGDRMAEQVTHSFSERPGSERNGTKIRDI